MMELESMAVEMPEVKGHPNRAAFRGVLTVVDVASQRAPSGAKGRRVVLTREAAEAALPSLIGMALDYAPSYDRHDVRRKVGIITSADVVGRNLEVGGYLYGKDFPDVVEEVQRSGRRPTMNEIKTPTSGKTGQQWGTLAQLSGQMSEFRRLAKAARHGAPHIWCEGGRVRNELASAVKRLREMTAGMRSKPPALRAASEKANDAAGLGMSFEVADVIMADQRSQIWILTKVTFTGAAILRRNRAAYEDTWIALSPEL